MMQAAKNYNHHFMIWELWNQKVTNLFQGYNEPDAQMNKTQLLFSCLLLLLKEHFILKNKKGIVLLYIEIQPSVVEKLKHCI